MGRRNRNKSDTSKKVIAIRQVRECHACHSVGCRRGHSIHCVGRSSVPTNEIQHKNAVFYLTCDVRAWCRIPYCAHGKHGKRRPRKEPNATTGCGVITDPQCRRILKDVSCDIVGDRKRRRGRSDQGCARSCCRKGPCQAHKVDAARAAAVKCGIKRPTPDRNAVTVERSQLRESTRT